MFLHPTLPKLGHKITFEWNYLPLASSPLTDTQPYVCDLEAFLIFLGVWFSEANTKRSVHLPNSEMYILYSSILTFLIELKLDMIPMAGNLESIFIPCNKNNNKLIKNNITITLPTIQH